MSVAAKKASTTKKKSKKPRHIGTMKRRASNDRIDDAAWQAGKLRRDKLRSGLYFKAVGDNSYQSSLESFISDIKAELRERLPGALVGAKRLSDIKEIRQNYNGKLPPSIHSAPIKIKTICLQQAMSRLEKQHSEMIAMPFTYLLTEEQIELCRNQSDRGFASRLGQRIQRKCREVLGYSPAFYFTFENPPVSAEKRKNIHDTLPHIHGAMLFREEDKSVIRQALYKLNNADVKSVFHLQELRFHRSKRKECVDALGEFDADVGWAIYQTKDLLGVRVRNHSRNIKGFEDVQFATQEVNAVAKAIYADFRVCYNKPILKSPKRAKGACSAILGVPTGATYASLVNTMFDEEAATATALTPAQIEMLCDEIMASKYQKKERECICNDIYKHGITGDIIIQSIRDGKNPFDGINTGRAPVLRIACDLIIAGAYSLERLANEFENSGKNRPYAKRRSSVVHNSLKILKILPNH